MPVEGLSAEQMCGLFGELWFLLIWLLPRGIRRVQNRVGPTGARHDFSWPTITVEAKTTQSARGHVHRISGLDQLDPPCGGDLFLFSLRMREGSVVLTR